MKRLVTPAMVLVIGLAVLSGCVTTAAAAAKLTLKEKDGLLTCTDIQNSPFENSGLKITIKKGQNGYAQFVKTDKKGNETKDYYKFDFATNTAVKYSYVSAMGTAYYYYYNLQKGELTKIENGDHADVTQSTKNAKRWDNAAATVDEEIKALQSYFVAQFGMTIEKAVKN